MVKTTPEVLSFLLVVVASHLITNSVPFTLAFSPTCSSPRTQATVQLSSRNNNSDDDATSSIARRSFLADATASSVSALGLSLLLPSPAVAASVPVQRAVGSAETSCREAGDCLQKLELDGAVGWNWGGLDRCAATDPLCGPDGRLLDALPEGVSVPNPAGLEVTNVVELTLAIGSGSTSDVGTIRLGLYGDACPALVREMVDLCGNGLVTSKNLLLGAPVRLGNDCGSVTYQKTEERLEFGVLSQKVAYAKSLRRAKAPDEFVPQPRPGGDRLDAVRAESSARKHDAAGLISLPKDGIGYGYGLVPGKDDEAYALAFQITAAAVPDMDKEGRKVIGQLLDKESMDLLARLAASPTRKMLPGQNGGTPLIKVIVESCTVSAVAKKEVSDS